jgi:uncharacterized protein YfbU (UPF0304 family)
LANGVLLRPEKSALNGKAYPRFPSEHFTMTFNTAEKLQIALLCDLARPESKRELDPEFIHEAVINDDIWALAWRYPGLNLKADTPPRVKFVCDVLDMWDRLESDFAALPADQQVMVLADAYEAPKPQFQGFDGNNETEELHIARLLTRDLGRWSRFNSRDLNSHMLSIDTHKRMLSAFGPIWEERAMGSNYDLSASDITAVLRECIHPEHRVRQADGSWTFDRGSIKRS